MSRASDEAPIEAALAARVRRTRSRLGLTQAALAKLADEEFRRRERDEGSQLPHPNQSSVSALEHGQRRASRAWVEWLQAFVRAHDDLPPVAFESGSIDGANEDHSIVDAAMLDELEGHLERQRSALDRGWELLELSKRARERGDPPLTDEFMFWITLAREEGMRVPALDSWTPVGRTADVEP